MPKIFDWSTRYLKKVDPLVKMIIKKQDRYKKMTDEELRNESLALKEKMKNVRDKSSLLSDAFAICREASKRVLKKEHYPCQIQAGIAMLDNKIAEMATGEGKTLAAVLPAYFKALEGNGVHIITSNDYLAERDFQEMGKIFEFLGILTGLVQSDTAPDDRKKAYQADITYCSSSQVCFDYLRDNLVYNSDDRVLRGMAFALIDEADSILIDEAETPIIISGSQSIRTSRYFEAFELIQGLEHTTISDSEDYTPDLDENYDFVVNSKTRTVEMTERLYRKLYMLYDFEDYDELGRNMFFYVNNALTAQYTKFNDRDYVVEESDEGIKIQLIDKNTDRIMHGRRLGDGLHQAVQAKEILRLNMEYEIAIQEAINMGKSEEEISILKSRQSKLFRLDSETIDLATITFRNYLSLYDSVAGMTGTAMEARQEFATTYGLDVVRIPRNKPKIAEELPERLFVTKEDKYIAIAKEILAAYSKGRPVLIGTNSVEESEKIAEYLEKLKGDMNLSYEILNAKPENSRRESEIIANAGKMYAITIATNMAGRGTDIKVEEDAKKLGGLLVIGTERNISKRIDNQLKGRTGRQGDPGTVQFFSSLEDDMIVSFFDDRLRSVFFGEKEISMPIVTKLLDKIQREREGMSFRSRKATNEVDDVLQNVRKSYYQERLQLLNDETLIENITKMITRAIRTHITSSTSNDKFDLSLMYKRLYEGSLEPAEIKGKSIDEIITDITRTINDRISTLSTDDLIELRSRFLRNADMEFSRLCAIMKQEMNSPLYWFTPEEQKSTKRVIAIAERYDEFCDYILNLLLEQLLDYSPKKRK